MSLAIEEKFAFRFETQAPFETVGEVCEYIESRLK
jgi:acyl carrier protein